MSWTKISENKPSNDKAIEFKVVRKEKDLCTWTKSKGFDSITHSFKGEIVNPTHWKVKK